jgi:hypothetical protein
MITFAVVGALFMFVSEICVFIYPCYKVIHTKKVVVGVVLVVFLILGGKCTYVYKREYLYWYTCTLNYISTFACMHI